MIEHLNRISVRMRFMIMAILPIVIATALLITQAIGELRTYQRASALASLAEFLPIASDLIHQLQRERGYSSGVIAAKGSSEFRGNVVDQRGHTDLALQRYLNAAKHQSGDNAANPTHAALKKVTVPIAELGELRDRVDSLAVTVPEMAATYTAMIKALVEVMETLEDRSRSPEIRRDARVYLALVQKKEAAGLERATGAVGLKNGALSAAGYRKLIELISVQDALRELLIKDGSDEIVRSFNAARRSDELARYFEIRRSLIGNRDDLTVTGVTAGEWFTEITKGIDALKQVEDKAAAGLIAEEIRLSQAALINMIVAFALAILLPAGLYWLGQIFALSVFVPLRKISTVLHDMAEGADLTSIPYTHFGSVVGELARSAEKFKLQIEERQQLERNAAEEQAKRMEEQARADIERVEAENKVKREADARVEAERRAAIHQIADQLEMALMESISGLSSATTKLNESATSLSSASEQSSGTAESTSQITASTSGNVQDAAEAASGIAAAVQEISQRITTVSDVVLKAVDEAASARSRVGTLEEASTQIGDVVNLIKEIAEQTNLLALNATIEAARAGEAGKGFAVVASEVKHLASQTAQATVKITEQVAHIQGSAADFVGAIGDLESAINQTSSLNTEISAAIEEQHASSRQIADNMEHAATAGGEVASRMDELLSAVGDITHASKTVKDEGRHVQDEASKIEAALADVLSRIRAA